MMETVKTSEGCTVGLAISPVCPKGDAYILNVQSAKKITQTEWVIRTIPLEDEPDYIVVCASEDDTENVRRIIIERGIEHI